MIWDIYFWYAGRYKWNLLLVVAIAKCQRAKQKLDNWAKFKWILKMLMRKLFNSFQTLYFSLYPYNPATFCFLIS